MNREDLEHIIRAAADVTNEYEFIIIGSQSILGQRRLRPLCRIRHGEVGAAVALGNFCFAASNLL